MTAYLTKVCLIYRRIDQIKNNNKHQIYLKKTYNKKGNNSKNRQIIVISHSHKILKYKPLCSKRIRIKIQQR